MKIKMTEIRSKDKPELDSLLTETNDELRQLKTKAGAQDLKNVRSIRKARLAVARIKTRLTELKVTKAN